MSTGFIDIHSHIAYGLDDGSPSLEVSVAMLNMAAESGTADIVATPHANSEFEYDPALVAGRVKGGVKVSHQGGAKGDHRGGESAG